jgi:hypothetical protein
VICVGMQLAVMKLSFSFIQDKSYDINFAQVGGKFQFDMAVGDNILPHFGEYKILDRANKIQFTWNSFNTDNKDSLVTIGIKVLNENSCELTLVHELLPSESSIKDHTGGWTRILDCLNKECNS